MAFHSSLEKEDIQECENLPSVSLGNTFSLSAGNDFSPSSLPCRGVEVLQRTLLLSGTTAIEIQEEEYLRFLPCFSRFHNSLQSSSHCRGVVEV